MSGTHKITPSNPRIASLIAEVTNGNVKIPVFQREYVWEDEQIMSLLDSIYHGYPVGSLLLWSTKERLRSERNVGGFRLPDTPEDYPVNYVLDGQQRLTTLYGVFHSDGATDEARLAARFDVCFVPETEQFVHASVAPANSINLRHILDTTRLLPELRRFSSPDQSRIATLTERFKDYEFPVVTIKDRTNQEVCRVFQRINSSGTSLSTLELLAAWTWSDEFDLRNEIEALLGRIAKKGYEDLGETLIMRCLASIVLDEIEADALVDVPPARLIAGMARLNRAMDAAIDFLDSEIRIRNVVFVPFPIMLVPLVRFFAERLQPDAMQRRSLRRWFWQCAFTQRYRAGTNTSVIEDMTLMLQLAKGADVFPGVRPRRLGVPGEDLPHVRLELDDPRNHRNQNVLVVGAGDSALEIAIALSDEGNRVGLVVRAEEVTRAAEPLIQEVLARADRKEITIYYRATVKEVLPGSCDLDVRGATVRVPADLIVVRLGTHMPTVPSALFKQSWRINSTAAKAAICLLAQYSPRSFITGTPVDLGTTLGGYNARQFHHIYPKSFLAGRGVPFHDSNVIANICMLTAFDNNDIRDRDPREYFAAIPSEIRESVLGRALIPAEDRDGSRPYAKFVEERAQLLARKAVELIIHGGPPDLLP